MLISVSEIAERLNDQAQSLAPELLPNGYRSGNKWMASGIEDTGASASLAINLSGANIGHWVDYGNARAGEDKGDMLDLLRLKLGMDMRGAVQEAKRRLGIHDEFIPGTSPRPNAAEMEARAAEARERAREREEKDAREREAKAKRARGAWLAGKDIAGTPAELYLRGRALTPGGDGQWPGSLRFHNEMWCKPLGSKEPAMLGAIFRADGVQVGTHRTFLHQRAGRIWTKIDHPNAKMVLGNMWGGFIPISKGSSGKSMRDMPAGEPVYVTEGIEDAVVVRMMKPEARIVSAICVPNIGAIVLPEQARRLVVVCDRDDNSKAQDQLERSIAQQQARGIDVKLVMPPAELNGERIKDMNDWLQAWLAGGEQQRRAG